MAKLATYIVQMLTVGEEPEATGTSSKQVPASSDIEPVEYRIIPNGGGPENMYETHDRMLQVLEEELGRRNSA